MNRESTEFAPLRDGSFARWLARLLVSCLALARYQKHTRTILRPSDLVGMSQNAEFDERILHTALLITPSMKEIVKYIIREDAQVNPLVFIGRE